MFYVHAILLVKVDPPKLVTKLNSKIDMQNIQIFKTIYLFFLRQ